ncbi:unnamed protein product, partial [Musa hybrid cultivar]
LTQCELGGATSIHLGEDTSRDQIYPNQQSWSWSTRSPTERPQVRIARIVTGIHQIIRFTQFRGGGLQKATIFPFIEQQDSWRMGKGGHRQPPIASHRPTQLRSLEDEEPPERHLQHHGHDKKREPDPLPEIELLGVPGRRGARVRAGLMLQAATGNPGMRRRGRWRGWRRRQLEAGRGHLLRRRAARGRRPGGGG